MNDIATNVGEVSYTRVFDAPRTLVFRCMTTPEHLTHFWGPVGTSTPLERITIDARPGGAFETTMVDDASGAEYPNEGTYVTVDEPETLAFIEEGSGMLTTSTFADLGDGRTEVTIHQTNVPMMYLSPEAEAGFRSSLDRLDAHLATLTGR